MEGQEFEIGDNAPDFTLQDSNSNEIGLTDFRDRWVVLYFYPKDMSNGCTIEAIDFSENFEDFDNMNAIVLGVSADTVESHQEFVESKSLNVTLLSDVDKKVINLYNVYSDDKINRSTFIINPEGKIAFIWRNIKAENHVDDVKKILRELQNS